MISVPLRHGTLDTIRRRERWDSVRVADHPGVGRFVNAVTLRAVDVDERGRRPL